jgi:hypothetical protein
MTHAVAVIIRLLWRHVDAATSPLLSQQLSSVFATAHFGFGALRCPSGKRENGRADLRCPDSRGVDRDRHIRQKTFSS